MDSEELRKLAIDELNAVKDMIPEGPMDQVIPEEIQERMKSRLRNVLEKADQ